MDTLPVKTEAKKVERVEVDAYERGTVTRLRVWITADGLGDRIRIPVTVLRGREDGPVVGLTASVHGDELNGIPVIHGVLDQLDPERVRGTVVAAHVVNVPGYHLNQRDYADGTDLNRIFPGKPDGTGADVYAHRLLERVIAPMQYLIDLHTASRGRTNSLYIRADLSDAVSDRMSRVLRPQIILHNTSEDGTLRGAAAKRGIHGITLEVGNPQRFQPTMIEDAAGGVLDVLADLGLIDARPRASTTSEDPVVCQSSRWLYTDTGGVLRVLPQLTDHVEEGQVVAQLRDVFGTLLREYRAPFAGVVIGRSVNPVAPTGSRILHLGAVRQDAPASA